MCSLLCFKYLSQIVLLSISGIVGILLFTRGFLLSRVALSDRSHTVVHDVQQYKKAVVLVVDALRHDFVELQDDNESKNIYYHNKLSFLQTLLEKEPHNARLYKFIADPPTTTMQRLKGLTTGSLPTFVDAGSNFASAEITEDNIIDQLVDQGRPIVFMGDDTWTNLFPGRFVRSYPFPSFNVHDLHTVDRGVQRHLLPEMRSSDWQVIIAHFLGVDHCGHRYGPNHPAITDKLTELDQVFRSVVNTMDNDTILLIMGDHGMTKTGDHGGDSTAELEAALFIYSKKTQFTTNQDSKTVSQIDLVPTLSLLLGVPIPFSNLGSVIPDLLHIGNTPEDAKLRLQTAVSANQRQLKLYLDTYSTHSNDLPKAELARLQSTSSVLSVNDSLSYMHSVKSMCQTVWAKFDDTSIVVGLLHSFYTVIIGLLSANDRIGDRQLLFAVLVNHVASFILEYFHLDYVSTAFIFVLAGLTVLLGVLLLLKPCYVGVVDLSCCMSLLIVVMQATGSLSNSMVVHEDWITLFLCQSIAWTLCLTHCIRLLHSQFKNVKVKTKGKTVVVHAWSFIFKLPTVYLTVCLSVILHLASNFWACREEKFNCETPAFLAPLGSLTASDSAYKNIRYWCLSLPSVFLVGFLCLRLLKVRGNLNGNSPATLLATFCLPLLGLLLLFHWALSAVDKLPEWQRIFLPRAIYFFVLVTIFLLIIRPMAVYMHRESDSKPLPVGRTVSALFKYMKQNIKHKEPTESRLMVYGLGTVYSSTFVLLLSVIVMLLMVLQGDGMAGSLLLLVLGIYTLLDLSKLYSGPGTGMLPQAIIWVLIEKYFFFATGQQPTVTNIRWDAAFQGFAQVQGNYVIPAILLFINTFTSQVVFGLFLPLLVIVPTTCHYVYESMERSSSYKVTSRGEVTLSDPSNQSVKRVQRLAKLHITLHLIKVLASMLAAAVLRRHLMVWKIFAPAFVFEGAGFITSCLFTCLGYLFFYRLYSVVTGYIGNFQLEHVD